MKVKIPWAWAQGILFYSSFFILAAKPGILCVGMPQMATRIPVHISTTKILSCASFRADSTGSWAGIVIKNPL